MDRVWIHAASSVVVSAIGLALWLCWALGIFGDGLAPVLVAMAGVFAFLGGVFWLVTAFREHHHIYSSPLFDPAFVKFMTLVGAAFLLLTLFVVLT